MDPYRLQRQNAAIQKVLSELLMTELKDPRVGFVSVNAVKLNKDQTVAKVFISVIDEQGRGKSLQGLKKARGFLQSRLSDILRLRATPELRFVYDESLDRGLEVDGMLDALAQQGEFKDEAARRRERDMASLEPPRDLLRTLRESRRVWVLPHWNPDPDAMGGCLAIAEALRELGKDALALRYPDPPPGFAALPGFSDLPDPDAVAEMYEADPPDLVLLIDNHELRRTGAYAELLAGHPMVWCIDHHLLGSRQPRPGWIEPLAGAACLLVLRTIDALLDGDDGADPLSADMAANLYAGIVADTGGFRYPNTLPLVFEAAHRLSRHPIDVSDLSERVMHQRSRAGLELLQKVFATFRFHADGRILSLHVSDEMIREAGANLADTEGFISLAAGVAGLRFVVFLKDLTGGSWRVSLRALAEGDVQKVAATYGGGGHRQAAGCTVEGEIEALTEELVSALARQLGRTGGSGSA